MHKIKLTGTPDGAPRQEGKIFVFEITDKGSPNAPKGLPASGSMTYSVLLNQKQLNALQQSLKKESIPFEDAFFVIEGEPTMDITTSICHGDLGVIGFTFQVIPKKNTSAQPVLSNEKKKEEKDEMKKEKPVKNIKKEKTQKEKDKPVYTPPSEEEFTYPEGVSFVDMDFITIPEEFLKFPPNKSKTQEKKHEYLHTKHIDKPIVINEEGMLLDGYRRYIILKMLQHKKAPVVYQ